MLMEDIERIEIEGTEYPIHCSILVLEELQKEFGTIDTFESKLLGTDGKGKVVNMPDPHAIIFGLVSMINEGITIFNSKTQMDKIKPIDRNLLREPHLYVPEIAAKVHSCFMKCFERKKNEVTEKTDI